MPNDMSATVAIRPAESSLARGLAQLSGAPLDFIKTAAAFFMVLDHTNTIIFARANDWLFRFGRIAFPLFCFAVAAHVVRDRDNRSRSLTMLLVFAIVTQSIYAWAFKTAWGNVLWTLAAGTAVAVFLARSNHLVRHALLALALAVAWWIPGYANSPSDYGLIGAMFPATLVLSVVAGPTYWPWALAYGMSVNAFPHSDAEGWWVEPAIDAAFALIGGAVVVAASTLFIGRPRFLWRYALHVFYPGHIGLLGALRLVLPH